MTKKKTTPYLPMGRPTNFTPEFVDEILVEITEGSTERACFRKEGRPAWANWCRYKRLNPEIYNRLAQVERDWCAVHEDLVHKIAMDESKDVHQYEEITDSPKGRTIRTGATTDNTSVQRHKLQIETVTKMMKWKLPDIYGDKVENKHTGSVLIAPAINMSVPELPTDVSE